MAVVCDQCGKSLKSKSTLKSHIKAVHEKLRQCVCTICDKSFFDKAKLNFHQHKHSEVRNFHCDECGRSFKTRSDLYQVSLITFIPRNSFILIYFILAL